MPPLISVKLLELSGGLAVSDSVLSLLWLGFSPWLGNFCMPQAKPKREGKEERKKTHELGFTKVKNICSSLRAPS